MPALAEIVPEITVPCLEQLIPEIADSREPDERVGADLGDLVTCIVAGRNLDVGVERNQANRCGHAIEMVED